MWARESPISTSPRRLYYRFPQETSVWTEVPGERTPADVEAAREAFAAAMIARHPTPAAVALLASRQNMQTHLAAHMQNVTFNHLNNENAYVRLELKDVPDDLLERVLASTPPGTLTWTEDLRLAYPSLIEGPAPIPVVTQAVDLHGATLQLRASTRDDPQLRDVWVAWGPTSAARDAPYALQWRRGDGPIHRVDDVGPLQVDALRHGFATWIDQIRHAPHP